MEEHVSPLIEKVALVTGAAKGIGLGCARMLAKAGASVALVDVDGAGAESAAAALRESGATADAFVTDVSQSSQVSAMIGGVLARFGRLDIVVNNAGVHDSKSIEHASEADWDRIIAVNLKGVFLVTKAALPHLKATRGNVINMSSMVGLVGQANAGAYAASKGGIIALTKNLALDFAPYGIRVNCICPGWVETPLVNAWFKLQPDELTARQYINSVHPLGRIATIDDVGRAAVFLASEASAFVTGIVLPVDGGVTLGY
jgi:NAD(P)-dependent dehydrogenase (short-subunit alcohol dehydrogenase family)